MLNVGWRWTVDVRACRLFRPLIRVRWVWSDSMIRWLDTDPPCGLQPPQVNWSALIRLKTHPSAVRPATPKVTQNALSATRPRVHQRPRGHRHTPLLWGGGVRGQPHLWPGQPSLWWLHNKMFPSTLINVFAGPLRVVSRRCVYGVCLERSVKRGGQWKGIRACKRGTTAELLVQRFSRSFGFRSCWPQDRNEHTSRRK